MLRIIFVLTAIGIVALDVLSVKQAEPKAVVEMQIQKAEVAGIPAPPEPVTDPVLSKVLHKYRDDIQKAADLHNLDPKIVTGMLVVESHGDPYALSEKGAEGCMQTLPLIDSEIGMVGRDSFHCRTSITKGTRYLAILRDRYGYTNPYHAVVAYNRGPGGAKRCTLDELRRDKYLNDVRAVMGKIPINTFS